MGRMGALVGVKRHGLIECDARLKRDIICLNLQRPQIVQVEL